MVSHHEGEDKTATASAANAASPDAGGRADSPYQPLYYLNALHAGLVSDWRVSSHILPKSTTDDRFAPDTKEHGDTMSAHNDNHDHDHEHEHEHDHDHSHHRHAQLGDDALAEEQEQIAREIGGELTDAFVEYVLGNLSFEDLVFGVFDALSDLNVVASGEYELEEMEDEDEGEEEDDEGEDDEE